MKWKRVGGPVRASLVTPISPNTPLCRFAVCGLFLEAVRGLNLDVLSAIGLSSLTSQLEDVQAEILPYIMQRLLKTY